jgi:hypothetical protein
MPDETQREDIQPEWTEEGSAPSPGVDVGDDGDVPPDELLEPSGDLTDPTAEENR